MSLANILDDVGGLASKAKSGIGGLFSRRAAYKTGAKELGRFGVALPLTVGVGAVGAAGLKGLYNQTEGESGGYGSAIAMGAMAGVAMYAGRHGVKAGGKAGDFSRRMETWGKKSRFLGNLKDKAANGIAKKVFNAKEGSFLGQFAGKQGMFGATNSLVGASSGAITGAALGGTYGAFSDDETFLSGAFKGAMAGGAVGFVRGGGRRASTSYRSAKRNSDIASGLIKKEGNKLVHQGRKASNQRRRAKAGMDYVAKKRANKIQGQKRAKIISAERQIQSRFKGNPYGNTNKQNITSKPIPFTDWANNNNRNLRSTNRNAEPFTDWANNNNRNLRSTNRNNVGTMGIPSRNNRYNDFVNGKHFNTKLGMPRRSDRYDMFDEADYLQTAFPISGRSKRFG